MSIERWTPKVTVAAIAEHGGRYLLVEERTAQGLLLNNPAGHLEPGESPMQGAMRETLEETARQFEPDGLLGVYLWRRGSGADDETYLRFAYRGRVGEPLPGRVLDAPVVRTCWMSLDEVRSCVARHRSPLVLRCIEDHAAGRHWPADLVQVEFGSGMA